MRNKMLSKSVKLTLSVVFTMIITGCASNDNIAAGKVIAVDGNNARVYIGSDVASLQGKEITVRRLLPTDTVLEGEPLYSYQVVGTTVINAEDKANFIKIKTNDIPLKKHDIIELTE